MSDPYNFDWIGSAAEVPKLPVKGAPTTYIMEPDLVEAQTGKLNIPQDVAFDDVGNAYNTITGKPVKIVRRPNVLPVAKTPEGYTFAMPKMLDVVGNVMGGVAGAPVKGAEVLVGSGVVRKVPEAIKAAENVGPFYSGLERAVESAKVNKADAAQWLGYLKNQPGVKSEELGYVLNNLPEGPITKEALVGLVKQNKVELKEVVKGGITNRDNVVPDAIAQAKYKDAWQAYNDKINELTDNGNNYKAFQSNEVRALESEREGLHDLMVNETIERMGGLNKSTKYHDYQLPGGENYQEMLLTLPDKHAEYIKNINQQFDNINTELRILSSKGLQNTQEYADLSKKYNQLYNQRKDAYEATGKSYQSSHWDEPNILAHVRYNDRNIPDAGKSLHLEEIQSDWHQAGRKQGYKSDTSKEAEALNVSRIEREKAFKDFQSAVKADKPEEEIQRLQNIFDAKKAETDAIQKRIDDINKGVPDAPFKKNWDELAFKRMLNKAANEGYDSISWTPGEAQAARYDLSKQVSGIHWQPSPADKASTLVQINPIGGSALKVQVDKTGKVVSGFPSSQTHQFEGKYLSDVVGKEHSEKILGKKTGSLEGDGLKIGGEGMKFFYDKMLVDKVNALAKKYGAKVETKYITKPETKLSYEELQRRRSGEKPDPFKFQQPVHVLKLTPELRAKAKEGFPLFSSTPTLNPVTHNPWADDQKKKYSLVRINYDPFK